MQKWKHSLSQDILYTTRLTKFTRHYHTNIFYTEHEDHGEQHTREQIHGIFSDNNPLRGQTTKRLPCGILFEQKMLSDLFENVQIIITYGG